MRAEAVDDRWEDSREDRMRAPKADARQHANAESVISRWDDLVGPFYSASQATRICGGISPKALDDLRKRCAILGLETADGVLVYPTFQFDEQNRVIQGFSEVLQCFPVGPVYGWTLAGWLVSPLRALGGVSVVQWLRDGKNLTPVLVLARDAAFRLFQ